VDKSTLISNTRTFSNINLTQNAFTVNLDFSEYLGSYGPVVINGYMVKSGLNTVTDPTTNPRTTLAVDPTTVYIAGITGFSAPTVTGTLTHGIPANNVSLSLPYTGGTGGNYPAAVYTSDGVTGLTATLSAGSINVGNGNLVFTITGTPSAAGTAGFEIQLFNINYIFSLVVN
jgi:hypothetical protein